MGTEADLAARLEARKSLDALRLTPTLLEPYIHSTEELQRWGYFVEVPEGAGGDQPSLEGKIAKCERCAEPFLVKKLEEAEECTYHWGKPMTTKISGMNNRYLLGLYNWLM